MCVLISGTVKVWDPRQKDTPVANMEPIEGENKRDCWTVAFGKIQFFHLRLAFSKTAITMSTSLSFQY